MRCQWHNIEKLSDCRTKKAIQTLEKLELAGTLDSSLVLLWSLEVLGITSPYCDFASLNLPSCHEGVVLHEM